MELDLALAARRAVALMSEEWLTSKAAISMTTLLVGCACILNSPELSSIAPMGLDLALPARRVVAS